MNHCGKDLHSNNCVVVVSNEEDRIVYQKRLLNWAIWRVWSWRARAAGTGWRMDGLIDAGLCMHLAYPAAIRKYQGIKYSGDFAKAAYLAQLLRLGLLAKGYISIHATNTGHVT